MQAHILGEVGSLGIVLLRVYSRTNLPIFIEIGSYLTDKEQNISWHSLFLTRCIGGPDKQNVPRSTKAGCDLSIRNLLFSEERRCDRSRRVQTGHTYWRSSLVAIPLFACEKKRFSCQHKSARITWPLTLTLTLSKSWMQAHLETILCKFCRNRAIFTARQHSLLCRALY